MPCDLYYQSITLHLSQTLKAH